MRKTMTVVGTVLVLGLTFAGCDNNGGGGGNGGAGGGGGAAVNNPPVPAPGTMELNLTGRVYSVDSGGGFFAFPTFTPFPSEQTRTVTISDDHGIDETGTIASGQLNFTVGTPTSLRPIAESWSYGITVDPPTAQGITLRSFRTQAPGDTFSSGGLELIHMSGSVRGNSFSSELVQREHIFVDRDVIIRLAQDFSETWTYTEDDSTVNRTSTTRAFTLTIREGWNAIHFMRVSIGTFVGTIENFTSVTQASTTTISTADPGRQLRWVQSDWYD